MLGGKNARWPRLGLVDPTGPQWRPLRAGAVRLRRETLRTWASLTAVGRFADSVVLRGLSVEL